MNKTPNPTTCPLCPRPHEPNEPCVEAVPFPRTAEIRSLMAQAWDEALEYAWDESYLIRPQLDALKESNPYRRAEDSTFADRMAQQSFDAVQHESWRRK